MSGLFDLVDSVLPSVNGAQEASSSADGKKPMEHAMPTLFILDETLQGIYDSRKARPKKTTQKAKSPVVTPNVNDERVEAEIETTERLPEIKNPQKRQSPRRKIVIPPPPDMPPGEEIKAKSPTKKQPPPGGKSGTSSPDEIARNVLRSVDADIKRWVNSEGHDQSAQDFASYLEDLYLKQTLECLSSTSFVDLARKKVQSKITKFLNEHENQQEQQDANNEPPKDLRRQEIESYRDEIRAALNNIRQSETSIPERPPPQRSQNQPKQKQTLANFVRDVPESSTTLSLAKRGPMAQQRQTLVPTMKAKGVKVNASTHQRQQMLDKLLQLPPTELTKLPRAQQELVKHTKRYRTMLDLTPEQFRKLPAHQQQLIQHLRRNLNKPIQ